MPGACDLAEWNVPHAPHEHRSLLVEIDEAREKGLAPGVAPANIFFKFPHFKRIRESPCVAVLFLLGMAFKAELNQAIDEFRVRYARSRPQFRIHADGGEARQRVDLVDVHLPVARVHEEVDARQAGSTPPPEMR